MTVVSDLEQDWHTWHAARERDLDTDYGWLSIVAFDWLSSAPTGLQGLPGQWWADERAHVSASGELTLGGEDRAYELVATAAGDSRLNLSFHDRTNGAETAPWRTVTTGPVARDGSVSIDFNRAINLPFAFTAYGTCPAPVPGNRIDLPVTAGEKKVR
ncbi:DUF1684 domain-containing protein [Kribbella solani]|uniref:Uncharacterized protein (DUF1684 family) n=1 Tax=Kribbella solani TaxID=236067 RepID=A0A841DUT6_9ACTN|nr:DUF1684 domain-containing protein [Kribbella solani]MBB5982854.1 uncharacterized protein (DUF1684 family) [Kribbella solani]